MQSTKSVYPASPRSISDAPTVYPAHHDYSYTLTYDVSSVTSSPTKSVSTSCSSSSSQDQFDVMDAAAVLSSVTCRLSDVIFKMIDTSPDQTRACLPFIGQILDRCQQFVAVHQHNEDASSDSSSMTPEPSSQSQANSFIDEVSSFIASAAPSGVFSRRKAKRR